ncbi:MAG TPA: ABC transporter permease, partial [Casimicrobiaceae bacterium]|nr:ABC transporter permease [Casimicrobiaceae bacterium]
LIVSVNGAWMTVLIGMASTRFRDIPPLIGNLMQILMFVTPVFWFPSQLGESAQRMINMNFMYHIIEVMRAPMLGNAPSLLTYAVTIAGAIVGWVITFDLYARFRRRIPYWL